MCAFDLGGCVVIKYHRRSVHLKEKRSLMNPRLETTMRLIDRTSFVWRILHHILHPASFRYCSRIIDLRDYKIIWQIGVGPYAKVQHVKHLRTGEDFALKQMQWCCEVDDQSHFLGELELMTICEHPSIQRVYGFSLPGSIITDFWPNGTPENVLRGRLPLSADVPWLLSTSILCAAVAGGVLHSQKIIHCDLTLSHVYLNKSLEPVIPIFGFARDFSDTRNLRVSDRNTLFHRSNVIGEERSVRCPNWDIVCFGGLVYSIFGTDERELKLCDIEHWRRQRLLDQDVQRPLTIPDLLLGIVERCYCGDVSNGPTFEEIVSELSESASWLLPGTDMTVFKEFGSRLCVAIEADTIKSVCDASLLSRFLVNLSRCDLGGRLGSNGWVRSGLDRGTGDAVAIKTTEIGQKGGLFKRSDLIHLFLELQIQASLQDFWLSNEAELLLPLTKFAFDGGKIHIVMPEMRNGDVYKRRIEWTPTGKSKTIVGIAAGMSVLHGREIIHDDVKGQNVLLNSRNEPVIADIGFAQFRGDGKPQLGSSLYLARELLPMYRSGRYFDKFEKAEAQNDRSVDVYTNGVLVWTLFDDERN
jgi:serine/threonine protein kinase